MYIIAAIAGWFLRAWKIGQLETIAAEKGEDFSSVNPVSADVGTLGPDEEHNTQQAQTYRSPLFKRLIMWKRV
jgi:hypothetical protein